MKAVLAYMRFLLAVAGAMAALSISSSVFAVDRMPSPIRIAIEVQHGDWGAARTEDIQTVLTRVADVLLPYFPQHASNKVLVTFSGQGPRVLFDKSSDGAYRVLLNVQDARWDQFAYQFSHELCHIFTNYEQRKIDRDTIIGNHQWFEETLCEALSIFALNRVASSWENSPPYPYWRNYASAFREYAQRLLSEKHRYLPPDKSIEEWYAENQEALEGNPYLRQKNELLARWLLPLIENTPADLEAIGYLNREKSSSPESFQAYLESWYSCCPEGARDFIRRVMLLFKDDERNSKVVAAVAAEVPTYASQHQRSPAHKY